MESINMLLKNETVIRASNDVFKIGALLLGGRLLSSESITDREWMKSTALLLIGFAVYHIIVRHIFDPHSLVNMMTIRMAIDDVIKFGMAFIIARLINTNGDVSSLTRQPWVSEVSIILAGFAVYDIVFSQLIIQAGSTVGLVGTTLYTISDILKFGTMLVVSRFFSGKPINDMTWIKEIAGALGGVAIYDIISQRAISLSMIFN